MSLGTLGLPRGLRPLAMTALGVQPSFFIALSVDIVGTGQTLGWVLGTLGLPRGGFTTPRNNDLLTYVFG